LESNQGKGINLTMNDVCPSRVSRYEHIVFHDGGRRRLRSWVDSARCAGAIGGAAKSADAEQISPADESFLHFVFHQGGLNIACYRPETLRRRLNACLRALRVQNIGDAARLLLKNPEKLTTAIDALIIGVTSFFRDREVFDHLSCTVLPALPRRRRIWSIGCSHGHEIYSVAMLLAEQGALGRAELLATDCRSEAIARVRNGIFDNDDLKPVPQPWLERYFVREAADWRIADPLRQAVRARVADVTTMREPGVWDLILCRNMAIYLRGSVAGRLWAQLALALRPGGFLVLGKAERPACCSRLTPVAPCIYRRSY
jgi:chemotaxis methyl-accepting protein methylase